jgi:hypothetical protein
MTKPKATNADRQQSVVRKLCAQAHAVHKVVRFANDDVPQYLQNLRRFEQESKKVKILVK